MRRRLAPLLIAATATLAAQANVAPPPEPEAPSPLAPPPEPVPPLAPPPAATASTLLKSLPGVVVTYDSETVDGSGLTTVTGVTIALKKPDGSADPDNKLTIAHAEALNLDADAIDRIFNADRYAGTPDEAFRKLADRLTVSGVSVVAYGQTVLTIAESVTNGWEMKPFGFTPGGPNFFAQFRSPELAFLQIYGHLLDSTRIASGSTKGMHAEVDVGALMRAAAPQMPGAATMPPGIFVYDIGEIEQGAVDRGRFGKVVFRDLRSKSPQPPLGEVNLSMREGWIEGGDFSKILPAMMAAEWPAITREPLISVGASCNYDYVYALSGVGSFAVPEACMDAIPFTWILPTHFLVPIKGTFTPAPAGESILPPYAAAYFTHPLAFEIQMEATYDPEGGIASLAHYRLQLAEFGSFDMHLSGGGLQLDGLPLLPVNYMQTLSLVSGEIEVVDEGGVAKILDMAAAAQNANAAPGAAITPEALKMQAAMGVNMMVGAMGNTPKAAAMGEAMRNFLDKGGRLVVGVRPAKPMVSGDFTALTGKPPAEITETVGLYAEWTAPN
ncbi:MAG: hypothetical protein IT548_08655 [Alphaproteobacteria bacterium]|nr:hypothetical protein [Alphaproteobacteria bacterium]